MKRAKRAFFSNENEKENGKDMRNDTLKKRLIKLLEEKRKKLQLISSFTVVAEFLHGLSVETKQTQRKKTLVSELKSIDKQLAAVSRRISGATLALEKLKTIKRRLKTSGQSLPPT